ncbi:YncE family protein [Mycobacterium sp. SM1]|uniref:YncE family protein n=1 Tax=Mycobacterium sp. SM1 TaxID=2816243 RepID=UPI001BCF6D58|nr:YncE family protein [Mycobacterium sp. SM1]MBS4730735.1 YncE family protein [Mycobacterium sp. SM1]
MHLADCAIRESIRDGPGVDGSPAGSPSRPGLGNTVGPGDAGPREFVDPAIAHGPAPHHRASPPTVIATIALGEATGDVVVSPDGSHLYVGQRNSIVVISRLNNIVGMIPTGGHPKDLATSADGDRLYVTGDESTVWVVDTIHRRVRELSGACCAREVITPDGALTYAAHNAGNGSCRTSWISVYDTAGDVLATIPGENGYSGYSIADLAVSPNGTHVYAGLSRHSSYQQYGHGFVSVIDTAARAVIDAIDLRACPDGMTVSPDGSTIYATHVDTESVSAVDLATHRVTPIVLGDAPLALALTPDSLKAYVAGSCSLSVLDTVTGEAERITVGELPRSVQISPDGKCAYVGNFGAGTVSVIDTVTGCVVSTIDIGGHPQGLAISPDGCRLYASDYWLGVVVAGL